MMRPVGSSVRFQCEAQGFPIPVIHWYKDNKWIDPSTLADRRNTGQWKFSDYEEDDDVYDDWDEEFELGTNDIWTLRLSGLRAEDSADYKCVVSNGNGEISHIYTLSVIGMHSLMISILFINILIYIYIYFFSYS